MAFITTTANAISSGGTISGDITIDGDLTVNGDGSGNYDEIVNGNLAIGATDKFYLDGGGTTFIYESSDGVIDFYGDNIHLVSMKQNGTQSEVVINESTGDVDFRVESDDNTHAFFVQAQDDGKVGILTSSPNELLSIAPDTDVSAEIGRAHVGYIGYSDMAGFSHVDLNATGTFCLAQNNSGKTIMNAASGQPIAFKIANTDKAIISSSGYFGVGTETPDTEIHIKQGNAGSVDTHANYVMTLEGSGDTLLQFQTPNDATDVGIIWGDPDDKDVGAFKYDHDTDSLKFTVGARQSLVLESGLTTTGSVLTLSTAETTVVANDVLGKINFKAPLEASGTDAILVGASIHALATDTFAADNNATDLIFSTGASETATEKMRIDSAGNVGIGVTPNSTTSLHIAQAASGKTEYIRLDNTGGIDYSFHLGYSTTDNFLMNDSAGRTLFTAHSGNAGVGTTSPRQMFHAYDATADIVGLFQSGDAGAYVSFRDNSTGDDDHVMIGAQGTSMALLTDGTTRMTIDNSGTVAIDQNANAQGLLIDSEASGNVGLKIQAKYGAWIQQDLSGGYALSVSRDIAEAGSSPLAEFIDEHADNTQPTVKVRQDGSAEAMHLVVAGNTGLEIEATGGAPTLTFDIASNDEGRITFKEADSEQAGIRYLLNGSKMTFRTGGTTTRMVLDGNSKISLSNNDGNTSNTVFGKSAFNDGGSDVGADYNVAIGELAMGTGTIAAAQSNTAIGYRALTDITGNGGGGDDNVAIGYDAATNLTTGRSSVAIGKDSLATATTTNYCVAIGESAGTAINHADGAGQVLIGYQAGHDITSGAGNTMIGKFAGDKTVSNSYNTYVGFENGRGEGYSNVAIGAQSFDHTGGVADKCVIIGTQAMRGDHQLGADETVAVGAASMVALVSGEHNVAVGYRAQNANTDYDNNTAVGHDSLLYANGTNNTAIGRESGWSINTGSQNTFLGASSGGGASGSSNRITSNNNTGIGYKSLYDAKTDAEQNTAVGSVSGENITTGDNNTLVGFQCGDALTTTTHNTAIGVDALGGSSLVSNATVIGSQACDAAVTADADGVVAVGYAALGALTSGGGNTAVGYQTGLAIDTQTNCTLVGYQAGMDITHDNAGSSTLIGYKAGTDITEGKQNTAIGANALLDCTTADYNVAIGNNALENVSTGSNNMNTGIGYASAATLTTGTNNTLLGTQADVSASGATGQIAIGKGVACTGDNIATLGIGSNTASLGLDGSDTSWAAASSDERLKENIETSSAGLGFINDLRPVTYNWKKAKDVDESLPQYEDSDNPVLGKEYGETLHGFIAQEVKQAIDSHEELADGFKMWKLKDDGTQTVADGNLVPILVKAVQELSSKVEDLEKQLKDK